MIEIIMLMITCVRAFCIDHKYIGTYICFVCWWGVPMCLLTLFNKDTELLRWVAFFIGIVQADRYLKKRNKEEEKEKKKPVVKPMVPIQKSAPKPTMVPSDYKVTGKHIMGQPRKPYEEVKEQYGGWRYRKSSVESDKPTVGLLSTDQPTYKPQLKPKEQSVVQEKPKEKIEYTKLKKEQKQLGVWYDTDGHHSMVAVLDKTIKPNTNNCSISITMDGWKHNRKYSHIKTSPGGYIYERCHVLARCLSGQDIKKNLFVGTHQLNQAMNEQERYVLNLLNKGHRIQYEVLVDHREDEVIPRGVTIRIVGVDGGQKPRELRKVYIPNEQDNCVINYLTGQNTHVNNAQERKRIGV